MALLLASASTPVMKVKDSADPARVAVAFTGTPARIDGLFDVLKAGTVRRGFISGAGPDQATWLAQTLPYLKTPEGEVVQWLACCVSVGTQARTTLQNALETTCWLQAERITQPVLLITSSGHMRRAAAALYALVSERQIDLLPVIDRYRPPLRERVTERLEEFGKRLAMAAILQAPRQAAVVARLYGPWAAGCPPASSMSPH